MPKQRSGINRSLMWLRKVLEVTEETESPQVLSEVLQPTVDVFGWEAMEHPSFFAISAAAPASSVAAVATPAGVMRLILTASVLHTDTGVDHLLWLEKVLIDTSQVVELTSPTLAVPVTVPMSLDRWVLMEPGTRIRSSSAIALVAGAIFLKTTFIDIPLGQYVPPL